MWSGSGTLGLGLVEGWFAAFWWGCWWGLLCGLCFVLFCSSKKKGFFCIFSLQQQPCPWLPVNQGRFRLDWVLGIVRQYHYSGKKKAWLFSGCLMLHIPIRTVLPLLLQQQWESLTVSSSVRCPQPHPPLLGSEGSLALQETLQQSVPTQAHNYSDVKIKQDKYIMLWKKG